MLFGGKLTLEVEVISGDINRFKSSLNVSASISFMPGTGAERLCGRRRGTLIWDSILVCELQKNVAGLYVDATTASRRHEVMIQTPSCNLVNNTFCVKTLNNNVPGSPTMFMLRCSCKAVHAGTAHSQHSYCIFTIGSRAFTGTKELLIRLHN